MKSEEIAKTLFINPFFDVKILVTFHIGMLQENGESSRKLEQQLPLKIYNLMHNRGAHNGTLVHCGSFHS
jgi:hypothetical protein